MKITDSWNPQNAFRIERGVNNSPQEETPSFATELKESIETVNHLQNEAERAMVEGAVRGPENIHETMIKLQEAEIALKLLIKTRDKALEAYQEIMRMQF